MTDWVYFIRESDFGAIKIGHTANSLRCRLSTLQQGNPNPLRFIGLARGGAEGELAWHKRFAKFRLEREWFSADQTLLDAVKSDAITGARMEKIVHRAFRYGHPLGKRLKALHAWMAETGRTPESLADEIGWSRRIVVNTVLGHNRSTDGVGMYLAAAIARVSDGRFGIDDLYKGAGSHVYTRLLAKEAQRQAVSA